MGKPVETVGIVGLGLIGTSIAMAIRRRRVANRVVGVDVDQAAVEVAKSRGALDKGSTSIDLMKEADLLVIAVPPRAVSDVAVSAARMMAPGSVLMDVASTKVAIVHTLEQRLPRLVRYVGGHPMAGSEQQGAQAADPDMLSGRPFIVTPTAVSDDEAVQMVSELARGIGMRPVLLSPEDHDELVAQTSHLPYLAAAALVAAASGEALPLAGPAFGGFARLAKSPVELWKQICRENRSAIQRALGRFRAELDRLERALDDESEIQRILEHVHHRVTP